VLEKFRNVVLEEDAGDQSGRSFIRNEEILHRIKEERNIQQQKKKEG